MPRVLKRYENRKLYDSRASRHVSLHEVVDFIHAGEQIQVIDNATGEDITVQILGKIIVEEDKKGRVAVPIERLHDIIRAGGEALSAGAKTVKRHVSKVLGATRERIEGIRGARSDVADMQKRLASLERQLGELLSSSADEAKVARRRSKQSGRKKKQPRRKASTRGRKSSASKAARKPKTKAAKSK